VVSVLVAAVVVVVLVLIGAPLLRRRGRPDEVDRFSNARSLTSTWAKGDAPRPASPEQRTDD
jgi:membrane protein implicated in regulation of membrane protease activity